MLVVNRKGVEIYLPAQCCSEVGLPKDFTSDTFMMRELQKYKIVSAEKRLEKIQKLACKFSNNPALKGRGVSIEPTPLNFDGYKLAVPRLLGGGTFSDYLSRKVSLSESLRLKEGRWAFVYYYKDQRLAHEIIDRLKKASKKLQMTIEGAPIFVEVPDHATMMRRGCRDVSRGNNFVYCINADLAPLSNSPSRQLLMTFVLIDDKEDKPSIKRCLDGLKFKSQFMLVDNIKRKVEVMGVQTNILRQVNVKCGLDLCRLQQLPQIRNTNTMIVGLDAVKGKG